MRQKGDRSLVKLRAGGASKEEADRIRRIIKARGADVVGSRRRVLRRGSGAAVHELRVATRRLQAVLEVFGPRLPEEPRRRLDRRARRIRRQLGQERNSRVLQTLLRRLRVPADSEEGRFVATLIGRLDHPPRTSRHQNHDHLPGIKKRIRALIKATDGHRSGGRAASAGRPGARFETSGSALQIRVDAVTRAAKVAEGGDPESMHRLRIAVKRYRYVLEVLSESGPASLQASIEEARRVQRELGRLHDLDILIEWVQGASRSPMGATFLRRIHGLRGRQAARAQRRLARFRPAAAGGARRTAA